MKTFKEIIISVAILLIGLLLIEVTLRVIHSDMKNYDIEMWKYAKELKKKDSLIGHVHRKNKNATLQDVEIKLNSMGMRSAEPDPDRKKILFLGSSISLGWGVENDSTYADILENNLQQADLDYQVLNASVGNYNTYRYVTNFLKNQKEVQPDILVINYFINDVEKLSPGSDNWFLRNSQLTASLTIAYKKILSNRDENLVEYYKNLYNPEKEGFQLMLQSLENLSGYAKSNEVKVYFTIIPDIHFLNDYPFAFIHEKMKDVAQNLGFEVVDFYDPLKKIPFDDLQIIPGDSHPNAFGHRLMAEELSDAIISDLK